MLTSENIEQLACEHLNIKKDQNFCFNVKTIWKILTQKRSDFLHHYFRIADLRRAYFSYYMPLSVIKITHILKTIGLNYESPKVLDLGAGPLSGIISSKLVFGNLGESIAIDREILVMKMALNFLQKYSNQENLSLRLIAANLNENFNFLKSDYYPDIIIASYLLNEFGDSVRHFEMKYLFILKALSLLNERGVLVIIEPAFKKTCRDIMVIRNRIFSDNCYDVVNPCPEIAKCPLLDFRHNWCYSEFPHKRSSNLLAVDYQVGFNKKELKFSYLVIARKGILQKTTKFRIVSGLMCNGGVSRRYVCTSNGLLTLSERLGSNMNILRKMRRGMLIPITTLPKGLLRISKEFFRS